MPGPAGAGDPHLEQAMLAQLPPVSYLSRWQRGNSAPPPSPAPAGTAAAAPPAAQGQASPRGWAAQAGSNGAATSGGAAQAAGPGHGAHPKPVAPALKPGEREAGRLKALQMTQERKQIRDQLRQGSLSLAQALAQDEEAARGMRVATVVRALPGIGAATAARLMREAGIDAARRVGALTTGQTDAPAGRRGGRGRGAGRSSRPAHGARRPGAPVPRAWLAASGDLVQAVQLAPELRGHLVLLLAAPGCLGVVTRVPLVPGLVRDAPMLVPDGRLGVAEQRLVLLPAAGRLVGQLAGRAASAFQDEILDALLADHEQLARRPAIGTRQRPRDDGVVDEPRIAHIANRRVVGSAE